MLQQAFPLLQAFLALLGSPAAYSGKLGAPLTEVSLAGAELGLVALTQVGAANNNCSADACCSSGQRARAWGGGEEGQSGAWLWCTVEVKAAVLSRCLAG
jgi:hypothetical protein